MSIKTCCFRSRIKTLNVAVSNLSETGRLQFFFHSPRSRFPIRDLTNEQGRGYKTEPHIEKCAENYHSECYQKNNIIPFLSSEERYLFLFTTCKNQELEKYYNKRFIIGYIVKEKAIPRRDIKGMHYAVQGETKLFSFSDAYPLVKLVGGNKARHIRIRTLSPEETRTVLEHFAVRTNIIDRCVKEITRIKDFAK